MNPFHPDPNWKPDEAPSPSPKSRWMPFNGLFDRLLRLRDLPDVVRFPALLVLGAFADLEQATRCSLDVAEDGLHYCREFLERLRKGGSR